MKTFTITVPTTGYKMFEVEAGTEEEARERLSAYGDTGIPSKHVTCVEESAGDWVGGEEWEIEEG